MSGRDPVGTLYYSHNLNPRVAVAVARHLHAPLEYQRADPMGRDREAFRPINPNTRVPVLVEPTRTLWETDAIALRLATMLDETFWPPDQREEVLLWVSWGAHHFTRAGDVFYTENIIAPRYFDRGPDPRALAQAEADFHVFAAVLDDVLSGRTWLVGDRVSYADFRVASVLPFAAEAELPVAGYRNIIAWHERLLALDAWRDPFGGLDCVGGVAPTYDAPEPP
jgi:glutathione S-transferase